MEQEVKTMWKKGLDTQCSSEKIIKECPTCMLVLVALVLFIAVPLVIEWIAFNGFFSYKPITTTLTPNEWVAFWGSYLGAIGTVVLGIVAYKQNKALAKANERLSQIQEMFLGNLSQPILQMGTRFQHDLNNPMVIMKDKTQCIIRFSELKEDDVSQKNIREFRALTMKLPIKNSSAIPLMHFTVKSFCWTIKETDYVFDCVQPERTTPVMHYKGEQIFNLALIYPSFVTSNKGWKTCARSIGAFSPEADQIINSNQNQILMEVHVENQANISRTLIFEFSLARINEDYLEIVESVVYEKQK